MEEMLDRESELEAIENALDEAFDGGGRLVLIEGPGGIGKTRLLERALAMARERRCLALRATGDELEGQLAHSITLQLLSCARDTDVEIEPSDVFTAAGPAENESEAFHRLQWWLTSLATDRPILVAVDDAHWADLDSLRFMRFLARRLENTSITLLIASRPASDDGRRALLAGLQDSASVALRPSSLSESALRSIVADRLGSEPDAEFLTAFGGATGGNPFLVRELLTELARSGVAPVAAQAARVEQVTPASVSRMVLLRLVPMPESARAMARAIAILGEHATLAAAALVAEVETEEAAATWERLSDHGILARKEPPRFVHPLLRGAVLDDLGAPSRGALHDRAAEVLRTSGAPSAAIAVHLLEGVRRDRAWAVDILIETARTAEAAGALQASIAYLRRALEEPSAQSGRRDILRELCRARARAFDPGVADDYPEVLNGASAHEERAEIMSEWAFARVVRGQASEARELLRTAQGELDDPDSELGLRLQAEAAAAAWFAPASWGEAAEHILPLSSLAGDTPGRRLLLANVAYASVMKGSDAPAVAGIAERAWGEGSCSPTREPTPRRSITRSSP